MNYEAGHIASMPIVYSRRISKDRVFQLVEKISISLRLIGIRLKTRGPLKASDDTQDEEY